MTDPKSFYGEAYGRAKDPKKLDAAVKYLDMAIRAEAENSESKIEMAMKAALRNEAEAFA
jgi:hypothetical protein